MPLSEEQRTAIAEAAREYVGTPWTHLGRKGFITSQGGDPDGMDCLGLIIISGKKSRLFPNDFDIVDYDPQVDFRRLHSGLSDYLQRIAVASRNIGDVVLYGAFGIIPVHLGIIGSINDCRGTVIESSIRSRRVVEHSLTEEDWRSMLGVYTYKEGIL